MAHEGDIFFGASGEHVGAVHTLLAGLGLVIDAAEVELAQFGRTTHAAVVAFQRRCGLAPDGVCDAATHDRLRNPTSDPSQVPTTVFSGQVRHQDGTAMAGVAVAIVARNLAQTRPLVRTLTDRDGRYVARVSRARLAGAGGLDDLVVVQAFAGEQLLAESKPRRPTKSQVVVDVVVPLDASSPTPELEALAAALKPALHGRAPSSLSSADIDLLAQLVRRSRRLVAAYVFAETSTGKSLAAPLLYAWARARVPESLAELGTQPAEGLRATVVAAASRRIIAPPAEADVDAAIEALKTLATDDLLSSSDGHGLLLEAALPDGAARRTAALASIDHGFGSDAFWAALTAGDRERIERVTVFAAISSTHAPLVRYLASSQLTVRQLAGYDAAAWLELLAREHITPPKDIEPAEYAASLVRSVVAAAPTASLAAALGRAGLPGRDDLGAHLAAFLDQHDDFDFVREPIAAYVGRKPDVLSSIDDKEKFLRDAALVQRVFRVAPRYADTAALVGGGVTSSQQIAHMGRATFTARFGKQLGAGVGAVYDAAANVAAIALQLHAHVRLLRYDEAIPALGGASVGARTAQEELLGSLDLCACNACRSLLSPAAYLVDLLAWLRQRPSNIVGLSALDALLDRGTLTTPPLPRRPDIAGIRLDCDNTNVALPYIDLVNEILERNVVDGVPLSAGADVPQTDGRRSTDELRASPPAVLEEAYDTLATTIYPMSLPFELRQTEAEVLLRGLGSSRDELLVAAFAGTRTAALADQEIVRQRLGLPLSGWQVVTTAAPAGPWEAWGMSATVPDPGGSPTTIDFYVALRYVPVFLQQAGIAYPELLALLRAKFLENDDGTPRFHIEPPSPCDLDIAKLRDLDADDASRAHRFMRLARAVSLSFDDLDRALSAIGVRELTVATLTSLSAFLRLLALLPNLALPRVAAFFGRLDALRADGEPSTYQQLFLGANLGLDTAAFALDASGELATPTGAIDDSTHAPVVMAALGITAADLAALIDAGLVTDAFDLDSLSALVRHATLAQELRMRVTDYVALVSLAGTPVFSDPAASVAWVEMARAVLGSGFDLAEVRWLCDGTVPSEVLAQHDDGDVATVLAALAVDLSTAAAGTEATVAATRLAPLVGFGGAVSLAQVLSSLATSLGGGTMLAYLIRLAPPTSMPPAGAVPAVRRLQQIALLARVLGFSTDRDVAALFDRTAGLLDPNALPPPLGSSTARENLDALMRLVSVQKACAGVPCAFADIVDGFVAAAAPGALSADVRGALVVATSWAATDVDALDRSLGLAFPDDYRDGIAFLRMAACFALARRFGVTAERMLGWAVSPVTRAISEDIRAAVRSGYANPRDWFVAARPLQDELRVRQRDALVAYLVGRRQRDDLRALAGVSSLVDEYLIDVAMSPCQLTSRIKQAIGSVQLFVQRAMMGHEPLVTFSDDDQTQWSWMRNYRVWEANRRVFLYPEDWVLPELRGNKTPFFKTMEQALLQQAPLNDDAIESALAEYLRSLHEVAQLEVMGFFHQLESDGRSTTTDLIHVVARTRSLPHNYYYRRYVDSTHWTPWEKITLNIQSEHVIPVVSNRRLRLLWVTFSTELDPAAPAREHEGAGTLSEAQSPTLWVMTLHWSDYHDGKWTPASQGTAADQQLRVPRVSSRDDELEREVPVADTSEFVFNAVAGNELAVWCSNVSDLSGTEPIRSVGGRWARGIFHFSGCTGALTAETFEFAGVSFFTLPNGAGLDGQRCDLSTATALDFSSYGVLLESLGDRHGTVTFAHQYLDFVPGFAASNPFKAPFFFDDDRHGFFVMPVETRPPLFVFPFPGGPLDTTPPPDDPEPFGTEYPEEVLAALAADARRVRTRTVVPPYRSFFHRPALAGVVDRYRFTANDHPWVCTFLEQLEQGGGDALYRRWTQVAPYILATPDDHATYFDDDYQPGAVTATPVPVADVDFSFGGAYSEYNWELFYHLPMLVASRLASDQQFEAALRWLRRIFDPSDASGMPAPHRFWRTRPFFDAGAATSIQGLLALLHQPEANAGAVAAVRDQITQWRKHPFDPHYIAQLRIGAYQKATIMLYLDVLIGWADQLFRTDTLETLNMATQLYLEALSILGPRPPSIGAAVERPAPTFASIGAPLDELSDAMVDMETVPIGDTPSVSVGVEPVPMTIPLMLFCTPPNDKLLAYWDTIDDRLYKLRHCQNISGEAQQLPLFEPPLDPLALIRAHMSGSGLGGSVGGDAALPALPVRFGVALRQARDVADAAAAFGDKLLGVLKDKDAASLELLVSSQQIALQAVMREIKAAAVDAADQDIAALEQAKEMARGRARYFESLEGSLIADGVAVTTKLFGTILKTCSAVDYGVAAGLHPIPTATAGVVVFAPTAHVSEGGADLAEAVEAAGEAFEKAGDVTREYGEAISEVTEILRKGAEWKHEESEANEQAENIALQIEAATTRRQMAQRDLDSFDRASEQAQALDDFYRQRFTNEDLYGWMIGQVSALYFQTYQLAYDHARRAEQSYRAERGIYDGRPRVVRSALWDSLEKGLGAADQLRLDLMRLESIYNQERRHGLEIVKRVSLRRHAPALLASVLSSGTAYLSLGEDVFDADYPGHYLRRLVTVDVGLTFASAPATAPELHATLTLARDRVRSQPGRGGPPDVTRDELRTVVTGTVAAHDGDEVLYSGLFVADDSADDRLFPFECAGAVSDWRLSLPPENNRDLPAVTDVWLLVKYTALAPPAEAPVGTATPLTP